MGLQLYNTLTGKKEIFTPLHPPRVNMYVCGITPYDDCHLGHARAYVTFDVVRRYLQYRGYEVTYVQNFTNIDDKIIARANALHEDPFLLSDRYTQAYFHVMDQLKVQRANVYPKVTEHIPEIVQLIERLIAAEKAYVVGEDVYYAIDRFPAYGLLAKRNVENMKAGARVEVDTRKQHPLDFALWKAAKPGEPAWESPWGKGRPGWHIECSAMAMKWCGETFDIHGGGMDLIFPHHENEIAQSEGATGKPFVRYWLHNGFVTVNEEKMSKSLGNFFTIKDIFQKFPPHVLRYFLLSTHYRSPIQFSDEQLADCERAYTHLKLAYQRLKQIEVEENGRQGEESAVEVAAWLEDYPGHQQFLAALDDDVNTARGLAILFETIHRVSEAPHPGGKKEVSVARLAIRHWLEVLGLPMDDQDGASIAFRQAQLLLTERNRAREVKDWKLADRLRDEIHAMGYVVEDTPQGARLLAT